MKVSGMVVQVVPCTRLFASGIMGAQLQPVLCQAATPARVCFSLQDGPVLTVLPRGGAFF